MGSRNTKLQIKNLRTKEVESVWVDDTLTEASVLALLRCGAQLWGRGWDTAEFQVVEVPESEPAPDADEEDV